MPIAKGEDWGWSGLLPDKAPVAATDAEAASMIAQGAAATASPATIGIAGGDMARTLGVRTPYDRTTPKYIVPVDALSVELGDGTTHVAMAHVVPGDLRRDRLGFALMNAAFLGSRNIAPRSHPGDGKIDVVRMDLGLSDRLKAWKRMVTGTHVPHPGITIRGRSSGVIELDRPRLVRIDGQPVGRSAQVRFHVIPAAILVAVS